MSTWRLFTAIFALALGLAWTAAPALAQQTTGEKIKDKAESAKEKIEDTARDVKDAVKEKASDVKDTVKEKTSELKAKVKAKTHRTEAKAGKSDKNEVMAMQRALKDKGYDPGPVDGRMGPRSQAALTDYQKKEGLTPTGRWDDETATKLGVRMSRATTPEQSTMSAPSASPGAPPPTPTGEEKASPSTRSAP